MFIPHAKLIVPAFSGVNSTISLVQREFAFDVVVGYHNVGRASHFHLSNERQSHRNILANCESCRADYPCVSCVVCKLRCM